jgi:hypothetical protein
MYVYRIYTHPKGLDQHMVAAVGFKEAEADLRAAGLLGPGPAMGGATRPARKGDDYAKPGCTSIIMKPGGTYVAGQFEEIPDSTNMDTASALVDKIENVLGAFLHNRQIFKTSSGKEIKAMHLYKAVRAPNDKTKWIILAPGEELVDIRNN